MNITQLHNKPQINQTMIHDNTVYLTDQITQNTHSKSITTQTKNILSTINKLLKKTNSNHSKLLSTTI